MKTGRPRKLKNPVTVCIVIEKKTLDEIDGLRSHVSRGEYLNILSISDNLKTKNIIDLKTKIKTLEIDNQNLKKQKESTIIDSFRKSIYSQFNKQFKDAVEKMSIPAKRLWSEKIGCKPQELINYL